MEKIFTQLSLAPEHRPGTRSMTSVPWPDDAVWPPSCDGSHQVVPLFPPGRTVPRKRFLLLTSGEHALPGELVLRAGKPQTAPDQLFSHVTLRTIRENLQAIPHQYNYREVEAVVSINGRDISLRLGVLPSGEDGQREAAYSWWQWGAVERLWSGPLAEAWRIGGHIPAYSVASGEERKEKGKGEKRSHEKDAAAADAFSGDVLHGDIYLVIWRDGALNITAHFKSGYLHTWPKAIPASPILWLDGLECSAVPEYLHSGNQMEFQNGRDLLDLSEFQLMFTPEFPARVRRLDKSVVIQPWQDTRVLAYKSEDGSFHYLPPGRKDAIPEGVSRTFRIDVGLDGTKAAPGRYTVSPSWYERCGILDCSSPGEASAMAARTFSMIARHIQAGGFDTGFLWRYLRKDLRTGNPQQDGADWDGDLSFGLFNHIFLAGNEPARSWQIALQCAYHAADIAIYHGAWLPRLEASKTLTAPLPKFRARGILAGYLETGDPYLLDVARAVAGSFMSMESFQQPRSAIGRDAYPVTTLIALWECTGDEIYRDFARQTCLRLLRSQEPDGGFSGQAGAGTFSGICAPPAKNSISFGSGLLAPIALLTWASADPRWPEDFLPRLRRWADLMLELEDRGGGGWWDRPDGQPYALIGAGAMYSLSKAADLLEDPDCARAVQRYVRAMNRAKTGIFGTHAFLACAYAHAADRAMGAGEMDAFPPHEIPAKAH